MTKSRKPMHTKTYTEIPREELFPTLNEYLESLCAVHRTSMETLLYLLHQLSGDLDDLIEYMTSPEKVDKAKLWSDYEDWMLRNAGRDRDIRAELGKLKDGREIARRCRYLGVDPIATTESVCY